MSNPVFSLAYTSCRANEIQRVVNEWRRTASGQHAIEVVFCVDGNNPTCITAAQGVANARVVIQGEAPFNCVRGWNLAAANTTGKVIIAVADDFRPCQDWDCKLFDLRPGWVDGEYAVHTEDGYVHNIMVLGIITRKRYERFGYFFYPQYESLFSDTELTETAYRDGVVIQAKHILFEHCHPDCGKRPRDSNDLVHASRDRWNRGEMLFNYRKHRNFPIDDGPRANTNESIEPVKAEPQFAAYIQATRDDLCLFEVCKRLFDEGIRNFFFCIPSEYWSGRVTPSDEMDQVRDVSSRIAALGAKSEVKVFDVSTYRFPGDSRIAVETRVRNDSLAWVRQNGLTEILIVDGDELWKRGTFAKIKECIASSKPAAISCPMIPVVGLPGYPIDHAQDRVVLYVSGSCALRDCRTPIGHQVYLNDTYVVHFTGTRRTMEEIVEKHRQSGHYDDPTYDFEGWLRDVLPNIRPGYQHAWPNGQKGIHMYKGYQIWPSIRDWTVEEMAEVPSSIHTYLAKPASVAARPAQLLPYIPPTLITPTPKVTPFTKEIGEKERGFPLNKFRQ